MKIYLGRAHNKLCRGFITHALVYTYYNYRKMLLLAIFQQNV